MTTANVKRMTIEVSPSLKRAFRALCKKNKVEMKSVIQSAMISYIKYWGGQ